MYQTLRTTLISVGEGSSNILYKDLDLTQTVPNKKEGGE